MADKLDHDFGVVARGSNTVYKFELKNLYKEEVEISSVRSSCGCTSASIENPKIKTYGKAYIVAKFDTAAFTGPHSATLTVQIRKPFPAQLQLRVHGYIRGDVVFDPGSIDFATIPQGTHHEKSMRITYAGRQGWKIVDVRSASEHLEAELIEQGRHGGRIVYALVVRMLPTTPPGFLKGQVVLVTNDATNLRIPIEVVGRVQPELSVAPENLTLGEVPQGETVTKRLIVRGKKPFVVTEVACPEGCFTFETDDQPATRQLVTVTFHAGRSPGKLQEPITIATDLGESFKAVCQAYATVVLPEEKDAPANIGDASTPKTAIAP